MRAQIFDIDGTLLDSFEDDATLHLEAIRQVMGKVHVREAWEHYPRITDTGILAEICNGKAPAARSLVRSIA